MGIGPSPFARPLCAQQGAIEEFVQEVTKRSERREMPGTNWVYRGAGLFRHVRPGNAAVHPRPFAVARETMWRCLSHR